MSPLPGHCSKCACASYDEQMPLVVQRWCRQRRAHRWSDLHLCGLLQGLDSSTAICIPKGSSRIPIQEAPWFPFLSRSTSSLSSNGQRRSTAGGRQLRSPGSIPSEQGFFYRLLRHLPSSAILFGAGQRCCHRPICRKKSGRSNGVGRAARPLIDLLPPGTDWPELQSPQQDVEILVAELEDLDRVVEVVEDAFKTPPDERPQLEEGAAGRLGAAQAIVAGGSSSASRPSVLARPVPLGSTSAAWPQFLICLVHPGRQGWWWRWLCGLW